MTNERLTEYVLVVLLGRTQIEQSETKQDAGHPTSRIESLKARRGLRQGRTKPQQDLCVADACSMRWRRWRAYLTETLLLELTSSEMTRKSHFLYVDRWG